MLMRIFRVPDLLFIIRVGFINMGKGLGEVVDLGGIKIIRTKHGRQTACISSLQQQRSSTRMASARTQSKVNVGDSSRHGQTLHLKASV